MIPPETNLYLIGPTSVHPAKKLLVARFLNTCPLADNNKKPIRDCGLSLGLFFLTLLISKNLLDSEEAKFRCKDDSLCSIEME